MQRRVNVNTERSCLQVYRLAVCFAALAVFLIVSAAPDPAEARRAKNAARGAIIGAGVGAIVDGGRGARTGAIAGALVGATKKSKRRRYRRR